MHLREELSLLFDYERWATMRWIEPARQMSCESVLVHIIHAQSIWLSRIEGRPHWTPTVDNLASDLDRSVLGWQRLLLGADLSKVVPYVNLEGKSFDNTVLEITRQVLNHGTYHRGHLRGIASEQKFAGFPETDYILFCREKLRVGIPTKTG